MIVTYKDLYFYSSAVQNNGVTEQQIDMYERNFFIHVFGIEKAEELITYILANKQCTTVTPSPIPSDNPFGGQLSDPITTCTYGDLTEFINGNAGIWQGLVPLLANFIVLNIMSVGKLAVSRNVTNIQGAQASNVSDFGRLEKQQVNAIAIYLNRGIHTMCYYLQKTNPLNLRVLNSFYPVTYITQESGRPAFLYRKFFI